MQTANVDSNLEVPVEPDSIDFHFEIRIPQILPRCWLGS